MALVSAGSLIAILALAASAQALTKFGSDLRNNDGSVTQATGPVICRQDAHAFDATKPCDRVAVQFLDTGSPGGNKKAPKDGIIKRINLVAFTKGHFRFDLAKVKNLHGDNGKAKIVHRGPKIDYQSSARIQTFHVHERVHKGEYLAIRSQKTSFLYCLSASESTEQLLFQPVLALNGPFTSNAGHTSTCTMLLRAVYAKGS
ncbi:MAG TPA: hypothetical protein VHR37_00660 [Solirubrobacterales bacterium]|nr:hypothetical protein [Solirubrobacterales bacterium]